MFELINYSLTSSDRSSTEDDNGNLSVSNSQNQDHIDQDVSNTGQIQTKVCVSDNTGESPTHSTSTKLLKGSFLL